MTEHANTPPPPVRYVNADVVVAALAIMKDVAADREQLHAVKLSILRRRIVTLQQQIENQAQPISPPADDVREAVAELNAALTFPGGGARRERALHDAANTARRVLMQVRPRGTVTDAERGEALTSEQYLDGTE